MHRIIIGDEIKFVRDAHLHRIGEKASRECPMYVDIASEMNPESHLPTS